MQGGSYNTFEEIIISKSTAINNKKLHITQKQTKSYQCIAVSFQLKVNLW